MRLRWSPQDDIYVVEAIHLIGLAAHGETPEEAIKNFLEAVELWFAQDDGA
jgi:predicted RNase H-like HicB family nuclease